VVGIENDMRARFLGPKASAGRAVRQLRESLDNYVHHGIDVRDGAAVDVLFSTYGDDIGLVVRAAAAQPDSAADATFILPRLGRGLASSQLVGRRVTTIRPLSTNNYGTASAR
jgi:hypothetical protein